jgi:hypothetical protein
VARDVTTSADPTLPERLPFLEALSWFDRDWRRLSPVDILRRYEAGWRQRGVLADPSPEELEFIRALARQYGSTIDV